jgi:RNA-binding protein
VDELSGKQRRYLRGLGNALRSTVQVGRDGITPAVAVSVREAFNTSELIKVRLERSCPLQRDEAGAVLAGRAGAHLVQVLGQTVLLYRPDPDRPSIELPE